jgi:hypothetical protein
MTNLTPRSVSISQFAWLGTQQGYVAEMSDLGGEFSSIYDDANSEGLTLVSRDGRQAIVFKVSHTEVRDGDLLWWDLRPVKGAVTFRVRVFND